MCETRIPIELDETTVSEINNLEKPIFTQTILQKRNLLSDEIILAFKQSHFDFGGESVSVTATANNITFSTD